MCDSQVYVSVLYMHVFINSTTHAVYDTKLNILGGFKRFEFSDYLFLDWLKYQN